MTRRIVAFDKTGPAALRNVHTDRTGEPLVYLDEGEVAKVRIDLTGYLETAETISSATVSASSVTAAIATASPLITLTLSAATSNVDGYAKVTATLSSS